jgi:hypothetical protein
VFLAQRASRQPFDGVYMEIHSTPVDPCLSRRPRSIAQRLRVINEHDGNIINNRITETTLPAIEGALFRPVTQLTPAPGTDQDLEEFG